MGSEFSQIDARILVAQARETAAFFFREKKASSPDANPFQSLAVQTGGHETFGFGSKLFARVALLLSGKNPKDDAVAGYLVGKYVKTLLKFNLVSEARGRVQVLTRNLDLAMGFKVLKKSPEGHTTLEMTKGSGPDQLERAIGIVLRRQAFQRAYDPETKPEVVESLHISDCPIRDLSSVVRKLPYLCELVLSRSKVEDISEVANLPELTALRLSGLQVKDYSALRGLSNLKFLALRKVNLDEVLFQSDGPIAQVQLLDLRGAKIGDGSNGAFMALTQLPNLQYLIVSENMRPQVEPAITAIREWNPKFKVTYIDKNSLVA